MNEQPRGPIVTPEAVALDVQPAGLGSRMVSAAIDLTIQGISIVILVFALVAAASASGLNQALLVVGLVIGFLIVFGYYPFFEGVWNGQTPGKRVMRVRVVQADGQPLTLAPNLVRNLVRLVDILPPMYGIGTLSMIFTTKFQRLGDLAAGTIVVTERKAPVPVELEIYQNPRLAEEARRIETAGITELEFALARGFLERRKGLSFERRKQLAREVAEALGQKVTAIPAEWGDEHVIEAVAYSYRARSLRDRPNS